MKLPRVFLYGITNFTVYKSICWSSVGLAYLYNSAINIYVSDIFSSCHSKNVGENTRRLYLTRFKRNNNIFIQIQRNVLKNDYPLNSREKIPAKFSKNSDSPN